MAMYTTERKIAEKGDALARVVRALKKGHDFLISASPDEITKLLAPELKLDPATALKVFTSIKPGYGGDFRISMSRLQNDLKVYRDLGVLKRDIPLSELVDPRFAGSGQ